MLDYILDDLMPHHRANNESRQRRHAYNAKKNMLPEHPRSSTTDDVECFFSVLRDSIGKDFTLQEVKH